jgi:simple sugar transport system substrate-binding protein
MQSVHSGRRTGFTWTCFGLFLLLLITSLVPACRRGNADSPAGAAAPASGTTGAQQPAAARLRVVVVSHATAVPFFVPVRKGVEEAGKLLGVDVSFTGPPGFDVARQIEFIKAAIAEHVDGIGTTLPNPDAFNDVVAEAMDKGIPVIAVNADAPNSRRLAYIGQGNYEAGRSMGKEIVRLLPAGGPVALCIHTPGAFNLEERVRGVRDVLKQSGKFTEQVLPTTTDLVKATSLIASFYQGHPDTKGMFAVDDISGSAIAQVIDREGLKGKVLGGGFDLVPDVMNAIRSGVMQFTIDQQPFLQGFQAVMQLYLLKKYHLAPTDVNTGVAPVTAANVETVMKLAEQGYR